MHVIYGLIFELQSRKIKTIKSTEDDLIKKLKNYIYIY